MNYREYRDKWEQMPKAFKQEKVPVHLDLEITTYCQLECDFCPRTTLGLKGAHMDLNMAKAIIREFAEKGGCSVKFVYLGEPTLYPHLISLITYAKAAGILEIIVATNGNSISSRLAELMVGQGLDYIIFSVDSCHPNTYKRIRKGGNLDKVMKSLVYMNFWRKRLHKPLKMQIQCIPFPYNFYEIESGEYEEFFSPFVDKVLFSPYCEDYSNLYEIGEVKDFFCPSPFRRITVRVDGTIALCCGSRINAKIIGKFPEMSIEKAWNSAFIKDVRFKLQQGKSHKIDACRICPYRKHKEGTKAWQEMRQEIELEGDDK